MNDLPPPLTPPNCDLRAFRDLPLDVGRFRDSGLVTHESAEAIVAAVLLWGAAWHQIPAASLPDDDRELARFAGYGRAVEAWRAVRDGALRGFVKCSDGRLYNRTLAEKALVAHTKRLKYQWQTAKDRHRKAQATLPADQRTEFPDFETWLQSASDKHSAVPSETGANSSGSGSISAALPADHLIGSDGNQSAALDGDDGIPAEIDLKGRKGKGRESRTGFANANPPEQQLDEAFELWNLAAERVGWPKVRDRTDKRRKSLRARLRDHGMDAWKDAIAKAEQSPLLAGKPTWFSFDWLSGSATNFAKLREGNYDRPTDFSGNDRNGSARELSRSSYDPEGELSRNIQLKYGHLPPVDIPIPPAAGGVGPGVR